MKKLHLIGMALVAVFAFSAVVAAAASAAPEWLVKGTAVTSALAVETKGSLLLTDLKASILGESSVECINGALIGTVNSAGKDTVTEIKVGTVTSKGNGLTGTVLECKGVKGCEGTGLVYPIGLPWTTQLELVEGVGVVDDTTSASGKIGYVVECSIFGVKEEDECLQTLGSAVISNMVAETDVLGIVKEENTGECSLSKEKTGDLAGEGLIVTTNGEALEVSGE
jgi:hypothetical protein